MVVIRLTRVGKKNSPAYRVVVADRRRAVKRKFIEVIGHYNPISQPKEIVIDKDRALFWMEKGAMPSDTVRNLMADLGIIKTSEKTNKIYGKEKKKKELKEGADAKKPDATAEESSNAEAETEESQETTAEAAEEAVEPEALASEPEIESKGEAASREDTAETKE